MATNIQLCRVEWIWDVIRVTLVGIQEGVVQAAAL